MDGRNVRKKKRLSQYQQHAWYDIAGAEDKTRPVHNCSIRVYELKLQLTLKTYTHPHNWDLVSQKCDSACLCFFWRFREIVSIYTRENLGKIRLVLKMVRG
jgi:hypothetical protein